MRPYCGMALTPLEPQSRFGDKVLEIRVDCPQNGTAVLKGLQCTSDGGISGLDILGIGLELRAKAGQWHWR